MPRVHARRLACAVFGMSNAVVLRASGQVVQFLLVVKTPDQKVRSVRGS